MIKDFLRKVAGTDLLHFAALSEVVNISNMAAERGSGSTDVLTCSCGRVFTDVTDVFTDLFTMVAAGGGRGGGKRWR